MAKTTQNLKKLFANGNHLKLLINTIVVLLHFNELTHKKNILKNNTVFGKH